MKKKILALELDDSPVPKRKAPASAFQPGNEFAFKKGSGGGNPSGRPKNDKKLISRALRVRLGERAPDAIINRLNLPRNASWAQCVSASLTLRAACGDVAAARLVLEFAEPQTLNLGIGGMVDEDGDPLPVPSLTVVLDTHLAPGVDPDTYRPELYMDKTIPPRLPEPRKLN